MIPSRKEMMAYWFEHPIAGTVIAFGMVEGIKTIFESLVNAKGDSPFSTYTDIRSGDALDDLGHLTAKQREDLDEVKKGLKAASKMHAKQSEQLTTASSMHAEQARQLKAASKMHAGQAKTIEQSGSLLLLPLLPPPLTEALLVHKQALLGTSKGLQEKGRLCLATQRRKVLY